MKNCPVCNELLGDNVEKCFKCKHEFQKKFYCSKCNKPLENEKSSCECGGWAVSPIVYVYDNNIMDWTRKELKSNARSRLRSMLFLAILACILISPFINMRFTISRPTPAGPVFSFTDQNGSPVHYYYIDATRQYDTTDDHISAPAKLNLSIGWLTKAILKNPDIHKLQHLVMLASLLLFIITVLLINPYIVGLNRFFMSDISGKTQFKAIFYGLGGGRYIPVVKIMFIRELKTLLWTLLLIIPGIIKAYEYMMIPYILSENPDISSEEAFRISKEMMYGNKWDVFVLDLSFILWELLSLLTLGIAEIIWVAPYKEATKAQLYHKFRRYYLGKGLLQAKQLPGYDD
ncbi:MAG TPA: DUF975 family protein [Mobilitalea sp.]|nr:DUF975 family protein [Mobilitalea sp.]